MDEFSPEHHLTLAPLLGVVDAAQGIGQRVHPHHGGSRNLLSAKIGVEILFNSDLFPAHCS